MKKVPLIFPAVPVGLVSLILFVSGCSTVPLTQRSQLNMVSDAEITSSSLQTYNDFLSKSTLSKDKNATAKIKTVCTRLTKASEALLKEMNRSNEIQYYNWEVNLVENDAVNAFCLPGGKIVVYTGILPVAKNETGVAVVVGHEIAHVIAKHGNERMSQLMLKNAGADLLGRMITRQPAQTQTMIMTAYGLGAQVGAILPYSRMHELEADRLGMIIMAKAGYDPNEAVSFWERMNKTSTAQIPQFLSTHPTSDKRIEQMRSNLPESLKYYKK